MARTDSLTNFLTDIANSIRTKKGTTDTILASNFDNEIESIETGGDVPTKGFVVNEYDENGYATDVSVVGMTIIPNYYFAIYSSSYANALVKYVKNIRLPSGLTNIGVSAFYNCITLESIELPNELTSIGNYAFYGCTKLALTSLPSGLTSIGENTFRNCSNLALTKLPDGVTSIGNYAFQSCSNLALTKLPKSLITIGHEAFIGCTNLSLNELPNGLTTIGQFAFASASNIYIKTIPDTVTKLSSSSFYNVKTIKQISVNVSNLYGSSNSNGARGVFENCYGMIACWVGSNINTLYRYTFKGCTKLQKLFIDKPRATVETFTDYQYAFMNDTSKTGIIICNDDEGFMTKEEFDAIDWSTYTKEV